MDDHERTIFAPTTTRFRFHPDLLEISIAASVPQLRAQRYGINHVSKYVELDVRYHLHGNAGRYAQ